MNHMIHFPHISQQSTQSLDYSSEFIFLTNLEYFQSTELLPRVSSVLWHLGEEWGEGQPGIHLATLHCWGPGCTQPPVQLKSTNRWSQRSFGWSFPRPTVSAALAAVDGSTVPHHWCQTAHQGAPTSCQLVGSPHPERKKKKQKKTLNTGCLILQLLDKFYDSNEPVRPVKPWPGRWSCLVKVVVIVWPIVPIR